MVAYTVQVSLSPEVICFNRSVTEYTYVCVQGASVTYSPGVI